MAEESEKAQRTLLPKQERFCQLYVKYWNASRSAREAGYSEKTCDQIGYQLLQIPSVKERIKELTDAALKELGITKERVLTEYSYIAFLDPSQAYDELGQLIPIKEMPEEVRRVISKIKVFEQFDGRGEERELIGFIKEVEFVPKKAGLDPLAKHLGLVPEKLEHSGPNGKPIETRELNDLTDDKLDEKIQKLLEKTKAVQN